MQQTGHTVLVTGGGAGIGLALAERFLQAGNTVIITGRDRTKLDEAQQKHPALITEVADMTDAVGVEHLPTLYPNVNILVNNAAVQMNYTFGDPSFSIGAEIDTNLTGPLRLTAAYLPHLLMIKESAIVNVSSGLGYVPKQSAPVYCATKAGIHTFSKALRWQLENTPVKVFEIVPSLVDTAMTHGRGSGKITPAQLADEFWRAFGRNQYEIHIGKVKQLLLLNRIAPVLAERVMRYGL